MAGLASLASSIGSGVNPRASNAVIIELDDTDEISKEGPNLGGSGLRFQYFPETLNDTKQVNWQRREIPGASLPVYQWISSGERLISFQAYFSTDVNLGTDATEGTQLMDRLANVGQQNRNIDIRSAHAWLRRFTLPRYSLTSDVGTLIAQAPHKLILALPGSGIGIAGGGVDVAGSNGAGPDGVLAVMLQCDIAWEAFFPNGLPRFTVVQLSFGQIAQRGGFVHFPAADKSMDEAVTGDGRLFGYTVTAPVGVQQIK